jgi:hypothetical protein
MVKKEEKHNSILKLFQEERTQVKKERAVERASMKPVRYVANKVHMNTSPSRRLLAKVQPIISTYGSRELKDLQSSEKVN